MSSKVYIRIPAKSPRSPAQTIPEQIFKRIRTYVLQTLYHLLKESENDPEHPLHNYDACQAKTECEAQLVEYARGNYPFHRPLGATETPMDYWISLRHMPESFVLSLVGEKTNAINPNSMPEERAGSRLTFLNSDLRTRMDVKTMVQQIKVMQYYAMQDGHTKRRRRTPLHARDFVQPETQASDEPEAQDIVCDIEEVNDQALTNQPDANTTPTRSESEMDALAAKFASVLRCFDLTAPALLNTLSEKPAVQSSSITESSRKVSNSRGTSPTQITVADDICWD